MSHGLNALGRVCKSRLVDNELESYRSTTGPLELCVPVFPLLVSVCTLQKVLTQFGPDARSGVALCRQYSR